MKNIFNFLLLLLLAPNNVLIAQNQNRNTGQNNSQSNIPAIIYSSDFESSNGGWYQSSTPGSAWQWGIPNYNTTNTAHSGIKCWDINLDSAYNNNDTAFLYSPFFNLSNYNISTLSFFTNFGLEKNYDGMLLEYSTDGGTTWIQLGLYQDSMGTNWYNNSYIFSLGNSGWSDKSYGWIECEYNLSSLHGFSNVQFRFVFASDSLFELDGISIDDIAITEVPNIDIDLRNVALSKIAYKYGTVTDSLNITIKNKGALPLTNFIYSYSVNGTSNYQGSFTDTILVNQSINLSIPGFIIDSTKNNIEVIVTKNGDADTINNQKSLTINGIYTFNIPFSDSFDSLNSYWYNSNISQYFAEGWQLGMPNYMSTNSAHSGINAWDINLDGPYNSDFSSFLYSPLFNIASTIHPKLFFWLNYDTEYQYDGINVEYRYENSNQWNLLKSIDSTNFYNWYLYQVHALNEIGWSGNSNGWKFSYFNIDALQAGPPVQFRFVFKSDLSVSGVGASLDDFSIINAGPFDVGITNLISPNSIQSENVQCPLTIKIKNFGTSTITQVPIYYQLNSSSFSTYNWTGILPPDSSITITLNNIIPLGGNNNLKIYTSLNQDNFSFNDTINYSFYANYRVDLRVYDFLPDYLILPKGIPTSLISDIKNEGQINLTSFNIYQELNSGLIDTSIWVGNINPGSFTSQIMPTITPILGNNTLKIFVDDPDDHNSSNDTLTRTIVGTQIYNLPYSTDFETLNNDWKETHLDTLTIWELGSPNFGTTNTTHSGSNCWDINLNSTYSTTYQASLYTPYFSLPSTGIANLSFWLNYNTSANQDGVLIAYSTDGIYWMDFGNINQTNATNWYNSILFSNDPGWSGISSGWKQSSISIPMNSLLNQIIFRFDFRSAFYHNQGGFSLDDFSLSISTGLEEDNANNLISLYPNPAIDQVNLHLPNSLINKTLEIKNVLGQIITKKTITSTDDIIDIRNYKQGVYFISIESNSTIAKKFIKQ